jgi:hypothetical protein
MSALDSAAEVTTTPNGHQRVEGTLDLPSPMLGGWMRLRTPDVGAPFWREEDGTRHSYGSLRCGLDLAKAKALHVAHLEAIDGIATAAVLASERGDRREARRLAAAASRLCGEIVGRWTPSAVEVPKRS